MKCQRTLPLFITALIATITPAAGAPQQCGAANATLLAAGLQGSIGSTIGPGGALYVAEGAAGRISRIDPTTGAISTFATGLPKAILPVGGVIDVAFIGNTAYALVTMVGPDLGGHDIDGIYRIDPPDRFAVVANIGRWSMAHPPKTQFELATGVQYALETYRGGFLVTDGHLNRVLWVTLDHANKSAPADDSNITELIAFRDIVPTGLTVSGNTIYVAEAGPIPHLPQDGKVVEFGTHSPSATVVASGAPLLVDVEFGRGRQLYALAQGIWSGGFAGAPALPNTGSLVRANDDGTFTVIIDHLDRPTSVELIGDTAYVVNLAGEVWKIDNISCPPFGGSH